MSTKQFARHANAIIVMSKVRNEGYFENHKILLVVNDNIHTLTLKESDEILTFTNARDTKEYLRGIDCV
ncbi:MAG: hypothetical protein ACRC23_01990 [Aeromonas jandaei]